MFNEGDVYKMPKKGCINDQEGYCDQRIATSKAWKRSVKKTSSWSTICKSLCVGESKN